MSWIRTQLGKRQGKALSLSQGRDPGFTHICTPRLLATKEGLNKCRLSALGLEIYGSPLGRLVGGTELSWQDTECGGGAAAGGDIDCR